MELNTQKFALAGGVLAGILFIVCSAFFALWPVLSMRLMAPMIHLLDAEKYISDVGVTWIGFLLGLAQWVVYSYITFWIFAWLYNRFLKDGKTA